METFYIFDFSDKVVEVVVILVIMETFYITNKSNFRTYGCNPCYNGNLLHLTVP